VLTRNGWGAVVVAVAAFAIGRVFGLLELYVLGTGLATALALAVAATLRRPPQLVVRRHLRPPTVRAGEAARIDLQVTNPGPRRSPVVQLWEPVGDTGGATMNLAPLRRGESAVAAYRLPTSRRGVVVVGPMRARRRDVLGLTTKAFTLPGTVELLVIPEHHPVPFALGGSSGRLGEHLRLRAYGQSGSEFHSLRHYVQGDDLRRISWKASARSGELIVKETALEGVRRCTVVVDVELGGGDDAAEGFERAVSAAASLVTSAAAAGLSTRLVAPDVDLRGPDVAASSLAWLASVRPAPGDPGPLPSLRAGEGLGLLVLVTSGPSSRCAAEVRAGISPEDTLVVVATAGGTAGRFVVDASSLESFVESWSTLTGALSKRRGRPDQADERAAAAVGA